jgi:2-C-methyl-D-erythritol 2,4-cyclodiphosphate synthase
VAEIRVGLGFDVHRWDAGRPLQLGGVRVEGSDGLAGHSDGDVVSHALADAILGAAALGDLGQHLPDSDAATAGISGGDVLRRVLEVAGAKGYRVSSVDATVVAERPSIAPIRDEIRASLAGHLGIAIDAVSVKATRPEGLGLVGDGIGCLAIATLERS